MIATVPLWRTWSDTLTNLSILWSWERRLQKRQLPVPKEPTRTSTVSPPGNSFGDILDSIGKRLSSFDARLSIMEILKEFQASQQQFVALTVENKALSESVKSLTEGMTLFSQENKNIKENIIDLHAQSMRDNLVISGILEQAEDLEMTVKNFIQKELKLPSDTVKTIGFHRVHRLGRKRAEGQRPRPIVVKFEDFKQKELVRSRGRELKGTDFSINNQFPREILQRR